MINVLDKYDEFGCGSVVSLIEKAEKLTIINEANIRRSNFEVIKNEDKE